MSNITEVREVYWTDDKKDRVSALFVFEDGSKDLLSVAVSKTSEYWNFIEANISMETIDENTTKIVQEVREQRKLGEYRRQERDVQKKHNALFNTKIEAFEIPAVAAAPTSRKSKIRKAKSITEVLAQVAVCIIESENKPQE